MKLKKKLRYSALNIVTHPHSQQNYVKLFFALGKLEHPVKLRGDCYATISHVGYQDKTDKPNSPIIGEIVKYTNIDKDAEWYDIKSQDVATEEDLVHVKSLPDHLKPNMSKFSFIFYPDTHLLIFESLYDQKPLSPNYAHTLFDSLCERTEISAIFGDVTVTIVPQMHEIDAILSMSGLYYLRMITTRPNPDQLTKTEGKVKARLANINAYSEERIIKASRDNELRLDDVLKLEAKVAAKNGSVDLKRKNESGKTEPFNTKEHPLMEDNFYDPAVSSSYDELVRVGRELKERITNWIS